MKLDIVVSVERDSVVLHVAEGLSETDFVRAVAALLRQAHARGVATSELLHRARGIVIVDGGRVNGGAA